MKSSAVWREIQSERAETDIRSLRPTQNADITPADIAAVAWELARSGIRRPRVILRTTAAGAGPRAERRPVTGSTGRLLELRCRGRIQRKTAGQEWLEGVRPEAKPEHSRRHAVAPQGIGWARTSSSQSRRSHSLGAKCWRERSRLERPRLHEPGPQGGGLRMTTSFINDACG